jgi:hypothetical protein
MRRSISWTARECGTYYCLLSGYNRNQVIGFIGVVRDGPALAGRTSRGGEPCDYFPELKTDLSEIENALEFFAKAASLTAPAD